MGTGSKGGWRLFGWAKLIWRVYRDPATPGWVKLGGLVLALLYLVSPVDVVPEALFGPLGIFDDALLVPLILWVVARLSPTGGGGEAEPGASPGKKKVQSQQVR